MATSKAKKNSVRRVALVTGAGSGIGAATARRLGRDGFSVVCADVDLSGGRRTAAEIPSSLAVVVDVREPESCESAVAQTLERFGRLDVAVAAAGVNVKAKTRGDLMAIEEFRRVLDINLSGTFFTARAAGKAMIEAQRGGRMVFLGSIASQGGTPGGAVYAASKGGVLLLGQSLAIEWAPFGIHVNIIGPGVIETPMTASIRSNPETDAELLSRIPFKRYGKPEEIAAVISFLLSADASYMTGSYVTVDGGWLA